MVIGAFLKKCSLRQQSNFGDDTTKRRFAYVSYLIFLLSLSAKKYSAFCRYIDELVWEDINMRFIFILSFPSLLVLPLASTGLPFIADDYTNTSSSWYDCSAELGIEHPKLIFSDVYSDPPVVYKNSGQILYKTISYAAAGDDNDEYSIDYITADLTQMYHLWDKYWVPFVKVPLLDQCAQHDGTSVDRHGHKWMVPCVHFQRWPECLACTHPLAK